MYICRLDTYKNSQMHCNNITNTYYNKIIDRRSDTHDKIQTHSKTNCVKYMCKSPIRHKSSIYLLDTYILNQIH